MLNPFRRRKTPPPEPPPAPGRKPRVHDYTRQQLRVSGRGLGIERGDHLLIDYDGQTARYEVAHIEYHRDPRDMWAADLTLIPPTEGTS